MNGTSFFDLLLLIIFVVFIISRFMSYKLPRDDNKKNKPGQKPGGQPGPGQPKDPRAGNVVPLTQQEKPQKPNRQSPKPQFSPEEIEKIEGVEKIRAVDPSFNEKEFKQGAKQAYMLYWQAVAEGDEETIANLVAPRLFDSALETIETLEEQGRHRVTRIDKFDDMSIVDTRVSGRTALIDLKYTVTQAQSDVKTDTSTTEAKAKKVTTVWTWARNLADEDPNWELEDISNVN